MEQIGDSEVIPKLEEIVQVDSKQVEEKKVDENEDDAGNDFSSHSQSSDFLDYSTDDDTVDPPGAESLPRARLYREGKKYDEALNLLEQILEKEGETEGLDAEMGFRMAQIEMANVFFDMGSCCHERSYNIYQEVLDYGRAILRLSATHDIMVKAQEGKNRVLDAMGKTDADFPRTEMQKFLYGS